MPQFSPEKGKLGHYIPQVGLNSHQPCSAVGGKAVVSLPTPRLYLLTGQSGTGKLVSVAIQEAYSQ
jgi:hypothetical protein